MADGTGAAQPSLVELATSDGTGIERSVLAESRAVTSDGTGAEHSVLAESRATVTSDGTGVEHSVLAESRAIAGGTDDERSPGGQGEGGGQGLGMGDTPGLVR